MLPRLLAALATLLSAPAELPTFDAPTNRATLARRPLDAPVAIAAGTFHMGSSETERAAALELCRSEIGPAHAAACTPELFAGEAPERTVYLSAFAIDRVEVTVAAYRACVRAGACAADPLLVPDARLLAPALPITSVTWGEAAAYCAWRGARLPSEAEWERAARGTQGRVWPWGNEPRTDADNHGRFTRAADLEGSIVALVRPDERDGFALLAPVGSFPHGASLEGVLDLAGNAMEWTADYYGQDPPQKARSVNPRGPAVGALRSLRGGSWRLPPLFTRAAARDGAPPETRSPEIGFRCAR